MTDPEGSVVVKSTRAGLGDLILGVLQGILYSRLSGRTLVVDWKNSLYAPPSINLFQELFGLRLLPHSTSINRPGTVRPSVWEGHIDYPIAKMLEKFHRTWNLDSCLNEFSASLDRVDHPETNVILFDYRNFGRMRAHFRDEFIYLSKFTNRQILADLAKRHLILKEALRDKADAWWQEYISGTSVGVHVRQTNESGSKSTNLPRLHTALSRVLRLNPGARVFLCTDNKEIERAFSATYRNVITREKWLPDPGAPTHLTVGRSETGIASARDAVIDMNLLSRCDILLYSSNSNFGFVSSLWSSSYKNIDLSSRSSKTCGFLRELKRVALRSRSAAANNAMSIKS